MEYHLSQKSLEKLRKEPLRRLLRFSGIALFILLIMVFISITDPKTNPELNYIVLAIVIIGLGSFFISIIKDDFLVVFNFKEYEIPQYKIIITPQTITWLNKKMTYSLNLDAVSKVALFYQRKKLKSITLYTDNNSGHFIDYEIDKLDLALLELEEVIDKSKFSTARIFQPV